MLSARLRKPEGFKGTPLFADDRAVDPLTDPVCQIKPDLTDVTRLTYNLMITDFNRCGVLKRNVSEVFYLLVHQWDYKLCLKSVKFWRLGRLNS